MEDDDEDLDELPGGAETLDWEAMDPEDDVEAEPEPGDFWFDGVDDDEL